MITQRPVTDRNTWLAMRESYLTASDIGAALGIDEHKSRLRLYAEKRGTVPDVEENGAMRRGRHGEAMALSYLQEDNPTWQITRPGLFYSDDASRLGCTPDAFVQAGGAFLNCQIKTLSRPSFEKWDGQPPLKYQLQVACENMLTGADAGILAVMVVSTYDAFVECFDVPRHAAAEARICDIARQFWADIEAGRLPPADYHQDAATLAALYPPSKDVPVPLDLGADNRIGALLEERERLKAAEKEAHEQAEALDAELVAKLAGAELAVAPGWRITRKMQHRDERLVKASDFPVLRVTRKDEAA